MELRIIIQKLYKERAKLDEIISSLEQAQMIAAARVERVKKRRGRTSMDPAERQQVSQRMKDYWARRRAQRSAAE